MLKSLTSSVYNIMLISIIWHDSMVSVMTRGGGAYRTRATLKPGPLIYRARPSPSPKSKSVPSEPCAEKVRLRNRGSLVNFLKINYNIKVSVWQMTSVNYFSTQN